MLNYLLPFMPLELQDDVTEVMRQIGHEIDFAQYGFRFHLNRMKTKGNENSLHIFIAWQILFPDNVELRGASTSFVTKFSLCSNFTRLFRILCKSIETAASFVKRR